MIAISVLLDAQRQYLERTGTRRTIKCFFSESDHDAFCQLEKAVAPFHKPEANFEIKTFEGKFEDATNVINTYIGTTFPLIFIDPTGWTGYPLDKIKPLFARPKCEVLINFMYDFINRFTASADPEIITSFAPILGGEDWPSRLDSTIPRGPAVERLFRDTLKRECDLDFVVSTRIDKSTTDRPHFFITYGTKSAEGLKAFRQIEYDALRQHAKDRAYATERKREEKSKTISMFADHEADIREATVDEIVDEQKQAASVRLLEILQQYPEIKFPKVVSGLLQAFMLRETNVKDICVDLAKANKIENTWGSGNRKPRDEDIIKRKLHS